MLSSPPAVVPSLLSASPSFSLSFPGPPGRLGFLGLLGGSGLQKLSFSLRISLRIHHFQLPGPPGSLGAPKMLIFIKNFNKNSSFPASWASWEAPGGPPGALPARPDYSRPPPGPPRASGSTKMPPFLICVLAKPAEKPYSLRAQKIKVLTAKPCGTSRKRPSKS